MMKRFFAAMILCVLALSLTLTGNATVYVDGTPRRTGRSAA